VKTLVSNHHCIFITHNISSSLKIILSNFFKYFTLKSTSDTVKIYPDFFSFNKEHFLITVLLNKVTVSLPIKTY
ncbi:hypothetical protein BpHYR1_020059, partial [Brachionus plicatilis]